MTQTGVTVTEGWGRFHGKVVIVTGAAYGPRAGHGAAAGAGGCRSLLVDVNGEALEAGGRYRAAAPAAEAALITADVSVEDEVAAYVEETIAEFGRIDGLYNNAGIEGKQDPVEAYDARCSTRCSPSTSRACCTG